MTQSTAPRGTLVVGEGKRKFHKPLAVKLKEHEILWLTVTWTDRQQHVVNVVRAKPCIHFVQDLLVWRLNLATNIFPFTMERLCF